MRVFFVILKIFLLKEQKKKKLKFQSHQHQMKNIKISSFGVRGVTRKTLVYFAFADDRMCKWSIVKLL